MSIEYSNALYQCFNELLTNAADRCYVAKENVQKPGWAVSYIKSEFDVETGTMTVSNDGQGIPIYKMDGALEGVYSVEGVATKEFTGSNFSDKEDPTKVTGGTNGLGMKLVIVQSALTTIETVDISRQLYYYQEYADSMETIYPPTVFDIANNEFIENPHEWSKKAISVMARKPHTTITFLPDYDSLCDEKKATAKRTLTAKRTIETSTWYTYERGEGLSKLIEYRMFQIAAFVSSISYRYAGSERIDHKKKPKIYFNKSPINIKSIKDVASMLGFEEPAFAELKSTDDTIRFPWSICVGVSDGSPGFEQFSLINGILVQNGGSHTRMLRKMIADELQPKIEKLLGKKFETSAKKQLPANVLENHLFLIDCVHIPVPQFTGQTKDFVTLSSSEIKRFRSIYTPPKAFFTKIWNMLQPILERDFVMEEGAKESTKREQSFVRKHKPAKYSGTKKSKDCTLFIPEGDSAEQTVRNIITSKTSKLGFDYFGMYNIQGVPPNVLKQIKDINVRGVQIRRQTDRLKNNKSFQGLRQVLGLDYNCAYETLREVATLNYGRIIVAVDQDKDGIGNIFTLIMVYFGVFFPALLKRGFISRFATPIVRVYKKGSPTLEFFSEKEFKEWYDSFGESGPPSEYKIKYYKGLATHSSAEVKNMGDTFWDNVFSYTWDDEAKEIMQTMYGANTTLRKMDLRIPITAEYDQKAFDNHSISSADHMRIEAKGFQLEFIARKMPNSIDGLNPSQRKALAGARKIWATGSKEMKVYQISGYVAKEMHYQHGNTSMDSTITKMAQSFVGACNIPLFQAVSDGFGDRVQGRKKTGSARYIEARLNKRITDLLLPRIDDWLLDYVYEDGIRSEPTHYVPIVPYVLLNTTTTTSVGWKIDCWARDFDAVITNVRKMIMYDFPEKAGEPYSLFGKPWIYSGMRATICAYSSRSVPTEVCFGTYEVVNNAVHVSQLPIKVWSHALRCGLIGVKATDESVTSKKTKGGGGTKAKSAENKPLPKKEFVVSVSDDSGNNQVDMTINMAEGSIAKIEEEYGDQNQSAIEDYLGLKCQLNTSLNLLSSDGAVIEFKSYEDIMKYWFPIRKQLYIDRLERQVILIELQIEYFEQIQRFIKLDAKGEISIDERTEADQVNILSKAKFLAFNKTLLFQPKYTKTEDLRSMICGKPDPDNSDAAESADTDDRKISYKYIFDITKRMTRKEEIVKRQNKIEELNAELIELRETSWKTVWLGEIDALEKMVRLGIESNWTFGDFDCTFMKARSKKKR